MTNEVLCFHLTIEIRRHYLLANLLYYSWVLLSYESSLTRHTVLTTPIRLIQSCLYYLTSEDRRHYVSAEFLSYIWVLLIIEIWFWQTHCVRYSLKVDTIMNCYLKSEKSYTMCCLI